MFKKAFVFITLVSLLGISGVYTVSALTDAEVETRITNVQGSVPAGTPSVPTGYDQKGYVASIIANIFDASQKIKSAFVAAFEDILSSNNNIPRWNASEKVFKPGTMYDVGGNIGVGTSTISTGLKLDVEGRVGATEYCDEDGLNCTAAADIGTGAGGISIVDLITPNFTTGYASYTGPTDVSGYDMIEFGGFDYVHSTGWGDSAAGTNSTVVIVEPGAKASINCGSRGQDCNILVSINASKQMSIDFSGGAGGTPRLAYVKGIVQGGGVISSHWTANGTNIYRPTGRVGIGTSTPATKFHVTQTGRFDGGVQVDGKRAISDTNVSHTTKFTDDTHYGYFEVRNNSDQRGAYFGHGNGGDRVNLHIDTATKLNISGGDVGIGENNPSAKLHVSGNIIASSPTQGNHVATKAYVDGVASGGGSGGYGGRGTPDYELILNNGNQLTNWVCQHNIDLEDICGDGDGCYLTVFMNHKTDANDNTRIISGEMYLEDPTFSKNNGTGLYGHIRQSGGGEYVFINGTGTRTDNIFSPWGWVYLTNYRPFYCPDTSTNTPYPASQPYRFSFMTHPYVQTKLMFWD